MAERTLSALGYLMDRLGLPTAALAHRLHVDPSLVSKWRSGSRRLTARSAYLEEICSVLLEYDGPELEEALRALAPLGREWQGEGRAGILRQVLTERSFFVPKAFTRRTEALCTAEIALYNLGAGRRQAVSDLLDVAEAMEAPGELLYMDCEQSGWLLEDEAYTREWVRRVLRLLDWGFQLRAALHFSAEVGRFAAFFRLCNPLIFHRNAHWYYHQYYDESIYWPSFFILEHAMSVMGMSTAPGQSSTTVFTDAYSILQHKNVVELAMGSCHPMFTQFAPGQGVNAARAVSRQGRRGETLFAYLPAPAFVTAGEALFDDILASNGVAPAAAGRCREANRLLRAMIDRQLQDPEGGDLVQILRLEEMQRRVREGFVSTSLSLLSAQQVIVSPRQYAQGLRELIARLERHPERYRLFLATRNDAIRLPDMNCWCRGDSWMVQMDSEGFRLCQEPTLSGAAYVCLEQGWRRVPPGRKDPGAVRGVLAALIDTLEGRTACPPDRFSPARP